jgi:ribonuclease Z
MESKYTPSQYEQKLSAFWEQKGFFKGVVEKGKKPFLAEKAEALGIPNGPMRRDLVNGINIVLADGRVVTPAEVMGEFQKGVKLVLVGDVGNTDTLVAAVHDADALVIEATYLEEEADMAKQFAHLTAAQASHLARNSGVKSLILTHISRRYREKDVLLEAQQVFQNVRVARDFDSFIIQRDGENITGA